MDKMNSKGVLRISCELKKVMDEENISIEELAKLANVDQRMIEDWYYDRCQEIDLDLLARVCYVMHRTVGDIFKTSNIEDE